MNFEYKKRCRKSVAKKSALLGVFVAGCLHLDRGGVWVAVGTVRLSKGAL